MLWCHICVLSHNYYVFILIWPTVTEEGWHPKGWLKAQRPMAHKALTLTLWSTFFYITFWWIPYNLIIMKLSHNKWTLGGSTFQRSHSSYRNILSQGALKPGKAMLPRLGEQCIYSDTVVTVGSFLQKYCTTYSRTRFLEYYLHTIYSRAVFNAFTASK